MRHRPRALLFVSLMLLAVAASFPLQIMALYGHTFNEMPTVLAKLTYINWLVMIALVTAAALAFEASPRLKQAWPVCLGLVALNNVLVGIVATDFSLWTSTAATLAFAGLHVPLSRGEVKMLLANPARRWWRASRRRRLSIPITFTCSPTYRVRGLTYDISESGVFVPIEAEVQDPQRGLAREREIDVCLSLGSFAQIRCLARIVREVGAAGTYPAGIGLEFVNLSREQRVELKKYLASARLTASP